ncbi:hypothetical protein B0H19DRAFT_1102374 [Mycena capillaripes]|nr:hypothetical protein B0H19DRAFT_1102374 [Mycena capillaripes]
MLSELPIELLQDIGDQLRKTDQKRLRAVCKDLRLAMNPLFFSDLVLDTQSLHLNEGIQLLTALASGKTAWTPFAKSVTIRPLKWQDNVEGDRSDDAMEELFDAALGSLKNVRSVMWDVQLGDPAWQYDAILRFLGTAPLLGAFELCAGEVAVLILAQLISLRRKLKIKENLALTSLHLYDTDILAELWPWIQETTSWRLMVINAAYSPQLIAYISSYSGLQKLALRDPEEGDPHRFWRDVLPLHAASLVELVCRPSYECAWSFNADMVDTISQLRRLTYLEMSVNKADIAEPVNAVVRRPCLWFLFCGQYSSRINV